MQFAFVAITERCHHTLMAGVSWACKGMEYAHMFLRMPPTFSWQASYLGGGGIVDLVFDDLAQFAKPIAHTDSRVRDRNLKEGGCRGCSLL